MVGAAMMMLAAVAVSAAAAPHRGGGSQPVDSLRITYLANEGVVLEAAGATVLIDALFGEGLEDYGVVTAGTRARLEHAVSPFDRVSAVLVTHSHRDHFDPWAVLAHLRRNPGATLIAAQDAIDRMRKVDAASSPLSGSRAVAADVPKADRRLVWSAGSTRVYALGLPHGPTRNPTVNVGYLIEIGGHRVLHIGDTREGRATFAALHLARDSVDVALLPTWYLTTPELIDVVRRELQPRRIVVLHEPSAVAQQRGDWAGVLRRIRADFPNVHAFSRELETLVVP